MKTGNRSPFVDPQSTLFTESTVGSGDQAVRYFEAGEGAVPLVVLYTGGIWRSPAAHELLARGRRIVRIVVPGFIHNYGEVPQKVGSLDEVLQVLGRTIDNLGIRQFYLMGSSLAAGFAAAFALNHLESVKGLVLVSPAILLPTDPEQGKIDSPEDLRARILAKDSEIKVPAVTRENLDKLESRVERLFSPSDRASLESRLVSLNIPTLILFGTDDRILSSTEAGRYTDFLPHASLVHIDGAGHVPEVERPEAFSQVVADFLSETSVHK